MNDVVTQAVQQLKQGNVIAYPTEAVWGLGCDPMQQHAFEKILQLKQRPIEKGVILLSDCVQRVAHLLDELAPEIRQRIIQSWQPDATLSRSTTWLLPIDHRIPAWIYGQHDRVAIRVSQHPLCQQLCQTFDGLIVSTSANPSGQKPAKSRQQVQHYFAQQVYIVDGALGENQQPSRIIDAMTGQIIRD